MDEGEVVVKVELAPVGVREEVSGDHLRNRIQRRFAAGQSGTSILPSSVSSLTLCAPSMILMEEAPLAQWAAVSTHL